MDIRIPTDYRNNIGPIIATTMVTKGSLLWSRYYLLVLSMSVFNLVFAAWSFWHYEAEAGQSLLTPMERIVSQQNDSSNTTPASDAPTQLTQFKETLSSMVKALKTKTVVLGALFIFAYQGAEVSISGVSAIYLLKLVHSVPLKYHY